MRNGGNGENEGKDGFTNQDEEEINNNNDNNNDLQH